MQPELIWTFIGFFLTILVFSYLFGDNPLFRVAVYLFVGVAAGYVLTLIFYQVLVARLVMPLLQGDATQKGLALVPLLGGLLLLTKLVQRFSGLGNLPMAYLVGAGAAAIVGGAVMGTLAGQTAGAVNAFDLTAAAAAGSNVLGQFLEASLFLVGTVSTLAYFHFSTRNRPSDEAAQGLESRRPAVVEWLARVGQVFIAITLGALFAGVYASAVSAMADRLNFFQQVFTLIQTTFLQ